jgi:hypothetical protein
VGKVREVTAASMLRFTGFVYDFCEAVFTMWLCPVFDVLDLRSGVEIKRRIVVAQSAADARSSCKLGARHGGEN